MMRMALRALIFVQRPRIVKGRANVSVLGVGGGVRDAEEVATRQGIT